MTLEHIKYRISGLVVKLAVATFSDSASPRFDSGLMQSSFAPFEATLFFFSLRSQTLRLVRRILRAISINSGISGLVVKLAVAIGQPPVRFRADASLFAFLRFLQLHLYPPFTPVFLPCLLLFLCYLVLPRIDSCYDYPLKSTNKNEIELLMFFVAFRDRRCLT